MYKTDYDIKLFSSARSGRVKRLVFAPPFLIFALFGINVLLQVPVGYITTKISFSLGMLLNQVGLHVIPVVLVIRVFGLTSSEVLPFKRVSFRQIFLAVLMMFSVAVITDYLVFATEWILPVTEKLSVTYGKLMRVDGIFSFIYKLSFLCLIPSFCEEVFFRGFCQTGLGRCYGRNVGIAIVAAMFALAHMSIWYVHIYFILGIFLGWLFATSGSLWIPIVCHVVNNLWTFAAHSRGWTLPAGGDVGWDDAVIISGALLIFLLAIFMWRNKSKIQNPNFKTNPKSQIQTSKH